MKRPKIRRPQRDIRPLSLLLGDDDTRPIPRQDRYVTAPVGPARTHTTSGQGWTMTVDEDAPPIPVDGRLRAAHQSMTLKTRYLEAEGMGYRIDDATQLRERGDKVDGRSVIARAGREGAAHLLGDRSDWLTRNSDRPWAPEGGWNEDCPADGVRWYDPAVPEPWQVMPVPLPNPAPQGPWYARPHAAPWTPPARPRPPQPMPWWVPEDPSGVRAACNRAFNGNGAA